MERERFSERTVYVVFFQRTVMDNLEPTVDDSDVCCGDVGVGKKVPQESIRIRNDK